MKGRKEKNDTIRLRTLAETFARLETASGRLTVVELVTGLLSRAADTELEPVVYLLQGKLRPPYEGVETGVGEKLLVGVLAEAYGKDEHVVTRRYKALGDLGLVAGTLSPAARGRMTVRHAYEVLLRVARTSGPGATARKRGLLVELLRRVGPLEARYLVRAVQGRLRLGVGDQTILDAAAAGALGDRREKPLIEHAYNVRSDLGGVVRLAYAEGKRGLAEVGPEVGVPVRPALAQRLASAEEIIQRMGAAEVEPKYDGFRLQCHRDGDRVQVFSRRLENVTPMFPDLATGICRRLRARRAIIEGEAVAYDPKTGEFLPFQVTMTRKRKKAIAETAARHPLRFFAFDLLYADGKNYIPVPQHERHRRLAELLPSAPDDPVAVTEVHVSGSAADLEHYFDEMIGRGLEGIVAKRPGAVYHPGARQYSWVKLKRAYQTKLRDTIDVVPVGYLVGRGKRSALGIGSLLAAVYDPERDRFRTVAKIGSGLSEHDWKTLRELLDGQATDEATDATPRRVDSLIVPDVWVEPRHVIVVLADEITRSPLHTCGKSGGEPGYALRFPRVIGGVRADKAPEDATTEREILEMYRMQRHVVQRHAPAPAPAGRRAGRKKGRGGAGALS